MPVTKGHSYSWVQILAALQAEDSAPPFALHRNGVVIGFALNRWQNPMAPAEILVGYGKSREQMADVFIGQKKSVPILIRETEDDSKWYCAGDFALRDWTDEAIEKNKRVKAIHIPAIYKILFMEESAS
jgi:hypothetical protein